MSALLATEVNVAQNVGFYIIAAVMVYATGFLDDSRDLPPPAKVTGIVVAALVRGWQQLGLVRRQRLRWARAPHLLVGSVFGVGATAGAGGRGGRRGLRFKEQHTLVVVDEGVEQGTRSPCHGWSALGWVGGAGGRCAGRCEWIVSGL